MVTRGFSPNVIFASSNRGKFEELSVYAQRLGLQVSDPRTLETSLGESPVVAEVSETYEGNAEGKARAYADWSRLPCLADDTGLEVTRLKGFPGRFTSRWGIERVAAELAPFRSSEASFVCAMSFADPIGRIVTTRVSVSGEIRNLPLSFGEVRGPLPFSEFFYPAGSEEPLSVLVERGMLVSHRYLALRALLKSLR